ncbi:hypothetical protein [Dasania marina]|uniref:hypothetical protein n=1 Tax=Dasania marina TaxID=471499 RepID=UPI0030DD2F55|tara:strand:+ start:51344 stop:51655 length:312 start_codon:yes stop_codon:yes gene_type:complete
MSLSASSKHASVSSDIHESWNDIKKMDAMLLDSAQKQEWKETLKIYRSRNKIINKHFQNHPISPATSSFYRPLLNDHLKTDNDIEQLRKYAVKKSLTLIHSSL